MSFFSQPAQSYIRGLGMMGSLPLNRSLTTNPYARPVPQGSISTAHPTLGQKLRQKASDALAAVGVDRWNANKLGGGLGDLADYLTPVGNVTQLDEGARQTAAGIQNRSLWQTAGGVGGMALAALPVLGAKLGAAERVAIDAFHGGPRTFAAERLIRDANGDRKFLVGGVDQLPSVPAGASVLKDYPLGRMRMDKLGTGEGHQAFGHGLYAAENAGTSGSYVLPRGQEPLDVPDDVKVPLRNALKSQDYLGFDSFGEAITALRQHPMDWAQRWEVTNPTEISNAFENYERARWKPDERPRLYQLGINADPESFLDWDKPISSQPSAIRDALGDAGYSVNDVGPKVVPTDSGKMFWIQSPGGWEANGTPRFRTQDAAEAWLSKNDLVHRPVGQNVWFEAQRRSPNAAAAADNLSSLGLNGIKFLDQGSRAAGEGSRNYVLFNDNILDILKRYGIAAGGVGLGTAAALSQPSQGSQQPSI